VTSSNGPSDGISPKDKGFEGIRLPFDDGHNNDQGGGNMAATLLTEMMESGHGINQPKVF